VHRNYLRAIAVELSRIAGGRSGVFDAVFDATKQSCTRIQRRRGAPVDCLAAPLGEGWTRLMSLWRLADAPVVQPRAATATEGWFAFHRAFSALMQFVAPTARRTHARTRDEAMRLVVGGRVPHPFSPYIEGFGADSVARSFQRHPQPLSPLSGAHRGSFEDWAWLILRTTAKARAQPLIDAWRRENPPAQGRTRRNLTADARRGISNKLEATTLFDVLHQLRLRGHYGDADLFEVGPADDFEAREFVEDLLLLTDASMAVVEAVARNYAGRDAYRRALSTFLRGHHGRNLPPQGSPIRRRLGCLPRGG